jgi:hypothetical protein
MVRGYAYNLIADIAFAREEAIPDCSLLPQGFMI